MRFSRLTGALLVGAMLISGCGGDDDEADKAPANSPATETSAPDTSATESPDAGAPLDIDEVSQRLEAAGYTVKEKPGGPLIRNEESPGGIVKAEVQLDVSGGELPSGQDVSVYSFSSPEDVAAMEEFSGGGVSLVKGELFFQAVEPGAAETVAEAAAG